MNAIGFATSQPGRLWRFMGIFQPPVIRVLHILIIFFVLLQFFFSLFMQIWSDGASITGWLHMWSGVSVFILLPALGTLGFIRHGFRHFYPYFGGDTAHLAQDARDASKMRLPAPRPGGLPAVIEGFGLFALMLMTLSGITWFILWQRGSGAAYVPGAIHSILAWLVMLFIIVHGGMGFIRFIAWQRRLDVESKTPEDAHHGPAAP